MPTYVVLTRLTPEAVKTPGELRDLLAYLQLQSPVPP